MNSFYPVIKELLEKNGCYFVKEGKGSHETWHSPITNINFTVSVTCASRHTANGILKQAGIKHKI